MSHFDRIADNYSSPVLRFFPFSADRLIAMANLAPGMRVLDVATGTGAVAFAAARMIAPAGRVQAIDSSEPMLVQAEKIKKKLTSTNTDLHLMNAQQMEFRNQYFDVILSGFGLNYFVHAGQVIEQCFRVAKPGATAYFSVFDVAAFSPLLEKLSSMLVEEKIDSSEFFNTVTKYENTETYKKLFTGYHWQVTKIESIQMGYHLANGDECWELLWLAGLANILADFNEALVLNIKNRFISEISKLITDEGLWISIPVNYLSASKPKNQ